LLSALRAHDIATDRIIEDLTLEERLDAVVDRAMRRLAQLKFMKEISGSAGRAVAKRDPAADRRAAEAKTAKEQKVAVS
jgi:hypothetical protein